MLRSEEIRHLIYDVSEGDQITENDSIVLHSDDYIFNEQSDCGEDTFFNADYVFADQSDVEDDSFVNAGTSTSDIRHQGHSSQSMMTTNESIDFSNNSSLPDNAPELCHDCSWNHGNIFNPKNVSFDN
uniref:Uncharacterized protein n=1 Tax=Cuerna arida TaxID=1464854 RepID=A0A1B6G7I2_9HEMI